MAMVSVLKRALGPALMALCLAGCGAFGGGGAPSAAVPESEELRLEAVPPQRLAPGECGLFLWAQGATQATLALVAFDNPARALYRPNGREREAARTSFSGARVHGHFEEQTFYDRDRTITVSLAFETERPITEGAAVQSGVIRVRDRGGWETVVPVGGMVACQK
jgi:hypothetical protein